MSFVSIQRNTAKHYSEEEVLSPLMVSSSPAVVRSRPFLAYLQERGVHTQTYDAMGLTKLKVLNTRKTRWEKKMYQKTVVKRVPLSYAPPPSPPLQSRPPLSPDLPPAPTSPQPRPPPSPDLPSAPTSPQPRPSPSPNSPQSRPPVRGTRRAAILKALILLNNLFPLCMNL